MKNYRCMVCNVIISNMKTHIREVHNGKRMKRSFFQDQPQCFICKELFSFDTLREFIDDHYKQHRNNDCEICEYCGSESFPMYQLYHNYTPPNA